MYKVFETELRVRPDDIDMYKHVHNSKYFDYVLAARYDQMDINYGMSMEAFMERGLGWLVQTVHMNFKRALKMGDTFVVRTNIENVTVKNCRVKFTILNKANGKISCDGWFDFVLIDLNTNRGVQIPADVIEHYTQYKA